MSFWLLLGLASTALLVIAWVIYPWLTIAAGERAPAGRAVPAKTTDLVSALLATRDEPGAVRARLEDLLAGDWPAEQMELIVAVDGDPAPYRFDGLAPAPFRLVVVGGDPPGGKATALNAGAALATGRILVLTDTHQRFAPDAIRHLVHALEDPAFAAVSGALSIGNEADPGSLLGRYWKMERRLRAAEARLHSTVGLSGSIYAIRPDCWRALPPGLILDDLWIPMRLILEGQRIGYEPLAVATDLRTTTPGQEFVRKVRTLTGNLQLLAWMPRVLLPWRNPLWGSFICHKLLRLATPYALLGVAAGVLALAFTASPPLGWGLIVAAVAIGLWAFLARGTRGEQARRRIVWGFAMQGAILVATWNGLRGRWDVWRR